MAGERTTPPFVVALTEGEIGVFSWQSLQDINLSSSAQKNTCTDKSETAGKLFHTVFFLVFVCRGIIVFALSSLLFFTQFS